MKPQSEATLLRLEGRRLINQVEFATTTCEREAARLDRLKTRAIEVAAHLAHIDSALADRLAHVATRLEVRNAGR